MDLSHFDLRQRPFRSTPDLDFYYPSTPHEYALDRLLHALDDDEGIILVTGEAGTGKTMLAHLVLSRLGSSAQSALITNCRFATRVDLLRTILFDLGLPYAGLSEQELRLTITEHLFDQFVAGRRNVLIFDEAQDLSVDLLEELRLLSNLESGQGKAVQIVLIALPHFLETLRRPEVAPLAQRVPVRLRLDPLDLHESADFLLHQIRVSGGDCKRVITDEAVHLLARHAAGFPRILNQAGHQALSLALTLEAEAIDVEVVIEALALLGIEADLESGPEVPASPRLVPLAAGDAEFHQPVVHGRDDYSSHEEDHEPGLDPIWTTGAYSYPPGPAQPVYRPTQ